MNPLAGRPLRYLIGADNPGPARDGEIIEVGYDTPAPGGLAIGYCNLFDEHNTGALGPYLHTSDTAAKYSEGQIDPKGAGWLKNLRQQFSRRAREGFSIIELDNPDAYSVKDVVGAVDFAANEYGFKVVAKNPLIMSGDPLPYVAHGAVCGVIVERGAGNPADMHRLRCDAGKPDLPVWFVSFGHGWAWAENVARKAKGFTHMSVTYSRRGEYGSSETVG